MKWLEAMIAWNPEWSEIERYAPGRIAVGPWPDTTGWSKPYRYTSGACWLPMHRWSGNVRLAQLFIDFHTCVVRDGIDPQAAHRAFLAIDEYRERVSPDIEGATSTPPGRAA
jgi:hypothetical protein